MDVWRSHRGVHAGASVVVATSPADGGLDTGLKRRHDAGDVLRVGIQMARADHPR